MRISAFQFAISGDLEQNYSRMKHAIEQAVEQQVQLLIFPECALTGYPPRNIPSAPEVDFPMMTRLLDELLPLSMAHGMHIVLGTIMQADEGFRNSAAILSPDGSVRFYHKRALWGWDRDNFIPGSTKGIFSVEGFKIGVRICYEVRFPEYFRELYAAGTDLNIVLFHDVSDEYDAGRYSLLKAHLRTRAAENVTPLLSVNAIHPFQTAPTALFDRSGNVLAELERNTEGLLVYDFENTLLSFSERGRKEISDTLARSTTS